MVENMGGINIPHNQLKIKGKNGQKIDLTELGRLQVTEKNKSLFAKYDKNNNGKIDNEEMAAMAKSLSDIAGNDKISKREIEKALGKGSYEELSKLAEQQNTVKNNKTYNEKGEKTNVEIKPDGTRTETDNKTGHSTEISPNGKITVKDSRGVLLSTTENINGNIITNEYLDLGNSKTYIKNYKGEGDNKTLDHVTLTDKKANTETTYQTEEDMKNNKPSTLIKNANNPITKQTTTYTYNEDETVSSQTVNSAGDIIETTTENKTHKYRKTTDKNGKITLTTKDNKPIKQLEFTVVEGKNIKYQMEEMLKKYDITLTNEQKTKFEEELIKENKNPSDGAIPRIKTNKKGTTYFLKEIEGKSVTATFNIDKLNEILTGTKPEKTEEPKKDETINPQGEKVEDNSAVRTDDSVDGGDGDSGDDTADNDTEIDTEPKDDQRRVEESSEGHEKVERQEPEKIEHPTGPKKGEQPLYDTIVSGQTTPINENEIYLKNDNMFQLYNKELNQIDQRMKEIETKYNITRSNVLYDGMSGKTNSDKMDLIFDAEFSIMNLAGKPEYDEYRKLESSYTIRRLDMDRYKKVMKNWHDGEKFTSARRGPYVFNNVERITLKNGQHAYKSDQGIFFPDTDGGISPQKVPQELLE